MTILMSRDNKVASGEAALQFFTAQ